MHFEEAFTVNRNPAWLECYLDIYKLLELIPLEYSLDEHTTEFFMFLEKDVHLYSEFYATQEISLKLKEEKVKKHFKGMKKHRVEDVQVLTEKLIKLASEAMETCLFLKINNQAARVLLTRYETHLSQYQKEVRRLIHGHIAEIDTRLKELMTENFMEKLLWKLKKTYFKDVTQLCRQFNQDLLYLPLTFEGLLSHTNTLKLSIQDFEKELQQLKGTSPSSLYLYHLIGNDAALGIITGNTIPTTNLVLTLFLVFFYMSNYYMLSISAVVYLSHLNTPKEYLGFLNACSPLASLIFSIVTGLLTKYSYKIPILLASIFILIGNCCYAFAVYIEMPLFLFVGRVIMGVGGSGLISRRYMAEHVGIGNRARWSAGLVSASSLGMVVGPLTAVWFDSLSSTSSLILPCLVWVVIFLIYFIVTVLLFKDVERAPTEHDYDNPNRSSYSYRAFFICVWIMILACGVQENLISSSLVIGKTNFGWELSSIGVLIAGLCFMSIPAHCSIALLANVVSNSEFLVLGEVASLGGSLILALFWYSETVYVAGSLLAFLSADILNGISHSLLSEKMPVRVSRAIKSSGLVSSISGLTGKTLGNISLSLIACHSLEDLLQYQSYAWFGAGLFTAILLFSCLRALRSPNKESLD